MGIKPHLKPINGVWVVMNSTRHLPYWIKEASAWRQAVNATSRLNQGLPLLTEKEIIEKVIAQAARLNW